MKQTIAVLVILSLLLLVGCGTQEDSITITEVPVEETPVEESQIEDVEDVEDVEVEEIEEVEEPEEENETVDITEEEIVELEAQEVITLFDFAPHPEELEIKVGTTVTWMNEDENFQHIIGWSKMPVSQGIIPPGTSWNYTFTEPGEIIWFSTPKPTVQGTITITE